MIEIDTRGKSVEEICSLIKEHGLGEGRSSDITRLRRLTNDKCKKVVCVA